MSLYGRLKLLKITEINPNKLDNDLIKQVFFNIQKENYTNVDYLVIYGCHLKDLLIEMRDIDPKGYNEKNASQKPTFLSLNL